MPFIDDGDGHEWSKALAFAPWQRLDRNTFHNGLCQRPQADRAQSPALYHDHEAHND